MGKKKGADDSGRTAPRRYYDPAVRPYPRRAVGAGTNSGPVGNSRQQRRQRARLQLAEQWKLAESMGFPVPVNSKAIRNTADADHWIGVWEDHYARL